MFKRVTIRKMLLMKCLTLKASSTRFKNQIQRVKHDVTRSKRSANKFEKLVNHQTAIFLLRWYFQRLRRKATSSLSSLRLVDQKGTRLKICKLQRIFFKVYIKLDDEEELVRLFEYFLRSQSLHPPSFSTFWTIRKLHIVIFVWKIFSIDL